MMHAKTDKLVNIQNVVSMICISTFCCHVTKTTRHTHIQFMLADILAVTKDMFIAVQCRVCCQSEVIHGPSL